MSKVKMKIKKGDKVIVTTGGDKGKTGEVLKVMPTESRVLVKGVNVRQKHKKPSQFGPGTIEKIETSIHVSNVALLDEKSGKASRVGYKVAKDGTKTRIAKKSGEEVK